MTQGEPSLKKLTSLLKRLKSKYAPAPADAADPSTPAPAPLGADPILTELLVSMLLWDAASAQARHALKRLHEHLVDLNELRVCVPEEIAEILGEKYPLGPERSLRLRSALSDIYQREHCVQLSHLPGLGKREARGYLESLDGVPAFAAARTFALALGGHAVPVDHRLRDLLLAENVAEEGHTCGTLQAWLERSIGADDLRESLHVLQAWADEEGHTPKRETPEPAPEKSPPKPVSTASPKPDAKPQLKPQPKPQPKSKPKKSKPATKATREKSPRPARKSSGKDVKS